MDAFNIKLKVDAMIDAECRKNVGGVYENH